MSSVESVMPTEPVIVERFRHIRRYSHHGTAETAHASMAYDYHQQHPEKSYEWWMQRVRAVTAGVNYDGARS